MFQKIKPHLKWVIPLVVIVILLALFVVSQSPQIISATVSPETALNSTTTGQTLLSFKLKLKSNVPVMSAFLNNSGTSTTAGLKVSLAKQTDGSFTGSTQIPLEWLKTPQTITFGLYTNGIKTPGKVRFAITDIPVVLPPDPGEVGKQTLEGIDSDNDGVRDDLQREIVFMYPERDEVRRVLRAMVKKEQDVITTQGDHEHFKGLILSAFAFMHCYESLVFPIGQYDSSNETILWSMARNTPERKLNDKINSDKATPFASEILPNSQACTQPLVKDQY